MDEFPLYVGEEQTQAPPNRQPDSPADAHVEESGDEDSASTTDGEVDPDMNLSAKVQEKQKRQQAMAPGNRWR